MGKFDSSGSALDSFNAQVHDLLARDTSGKSILVHPRVDEISDVLGHYHACKAKHSEGNSIHIVVPAEHSDDSKGMLHEFKLVMSCKGGQT